MPTVREIPLIPGVPLFGSLLDVRRDRIAWQHRVAREHKDIARARMGLFTAMIISSPELVQELLVERADCFHKSQGLSVYARPLLGNGLLTSEDDEHKKQRRMMAPAFAPKRIQAYADIMAERAEISAKRMIEKRELDLSAETMRLTLEIVGKTLFDAELGEEASEIGAALTTAMDHMITTLTSLVPWPPVVPTPGNLRQKKAVGRLDETVYRMIKERRAHPNDRGDVLSMLLDAQDEDGTRMNDKQVRDEAMTLFLAGHETTANGLGWTLYLLSLHPEIRERAEKEVEAVCAGRTPTLADLKRMPYVLSVFKESMRLYPPAYIMGRRCWKECEIGGYPIRKNQLVFVNIAGIHRRADIYPDPDRFDPDRFAGDKEKSLPRHAYMPFGAGPRICIGNHFALMEAHIVLAALLQRVRLDMATSRPVRTETLITLRPKGGLPMVSAKR
jgi:cytochrome P450